MASLTACAPPSPPPPAAPPAAAAPGAAPGGGEDGATPAAAAAPAARPPVVEGMPLPAELAGGEAYTFAGPHGPVATNPNNPNPNNPNPNPASAAAAFARAGLCCVRGLVSRELSLRALAQATASLRELFALMAARGVALEQGTKGGFAEVVQRSEGRYEMNYGMTEGVFDDAEFVDNAWLRAFVSEAIGGPEWELNRRSLLISFPGAEGQQWHVDGDHLVKRRHAPAHAINAFVALGDITLDMGPTELRPASHFLTRKLFKMMMLARARKQLHAPVMPTARSGDAVIFDYRTLHRGTANSSDRPRAMLELVFFRKGYSDLLNFPKRSVMDPPAPRGGETGDEEAGAVEDS
jgi:hypothetical protein